MSSVLNLQMYCLGINVTPAESLIKPKTFYKYSFVTATRFYFGGKIPSIDYRVLYEQERKRNSKLEKELGIRETQLSSTDAKLKAYEIAFGFRSLEEEKDLIVPAFLKESKLSRFQRIVIALLLDMTDYARLLRLEIENSNITVYEYARAFSKFYTGISNKFSRNQRRPPTPHTEEEWNLTFDLLGAFEYYEKKSVEIVFKSLPIPERAEYLNEFFVLLSNAQKITPFDIKQALNGLKGILQSQIHIVKRDIHGIPSSYVAIRLKCEEFVHASLTVLKAKKQLVSIFVYSYSDAVEDDIVDKSDF